MTISSRNSQTAHIPTKPDTNLGEIFNKEIIHMPASNGINI